MTDTLSRDRRRRIGLGLALAGLTFGLGACADAGALPKLNQQLDQVAQGQAQLLQRLDDMETALDNRAKAAAAAPTPAPGQPQQPPKRPPGPDPKATYKVAINGAHAKGPADAKITIVEWSDFQ